MLKYNDYEDWHPVKKGLIPEDEYQALSVKDAVYICWEYCDDPRDKETLRKYLLDVHGIVATMRE